MKVLIAGTEAKALKVVTVRRDDIIVGDVGELHGIEDIDQVDDDPSTISTGISMFRSPLALSLVGNA